MFSNFQNIYPDQSNNYIHSNKITWVFGVNQTYHNIDLDIECFSYMVDIFSNNYTLPKNALVLACTTAKILADYVYLFAGDVIRFHKEIKLAVATTIPSEGRQI